MAYVEPTDNGFSVRSSDCNPVRWFENREDAEEFMQDLHEKHDPEPQNRGERAREQCEEDG